MKLWIAVHLNTFNVAFQLFQYFLLTTTFSERFFFAIRIKMINLVGNSHATVVFKATAEAELNVLTNIQANKTKVRSSFLSDLLQNRFQSVIKGLSVSFRRQNLIWCDFGQNAKQGCHFTDVLWQTLPNRTCRMQRGH